MVRKWACLIGLKILDLVLSNYVKLHNPRSCWQMRTFTCHLAPPTDSDGRYLKLRPPPALSIDLAGPVSLRKITISATPKFHAFIANMSYNNDNQILLSQPRTPNLPRCPSTPHSELILLSDVSQRRDVEDLHSTEPKNAPQTPAAEHNRLRAGQINHQLLATPSESPETLSHNPFSIAGRPQIANYDHTRRMQTRVAVRDHLRYPHYFQVVPLREAQEHNMSVQRETIIMTRSGKLAPIYRGPLVASEMQGGHPEEAVSAMFPIYILLTNV